VQQPIDGRSERFQSAVSTDSTPGRTARDLHVRSGACATRSAMCSGTFGERRRTPDPAPNDVRGGPRYRGSHQHWVLHLYRRFVDCRRIGTLPPPDPGSAAITEALCQTDRRTVLMVGDSVGRRRGPSAGQPAPAARCGRVVGHEARISSGYGTVSPQSMARMSWPGACCADRASRRQAIGHGRQAAGLSCLAEIACVTLGIRRERE
jgi:hypothetical protein